MNIEDRPVIDEQDTAKVNPNSEPRQLDDLDVHWWWGFWDWLMEEGWGKTFVTSPSLSDWLSHKKNIYHRDHPHYDTSHTSNDEVDRKLGSKEVETQ